MQQKQRHHDYFIYNRGDQNDVPEENLSCVLLVHVWQKWQFQRQKLIDATSTEQYQGGFPLLVEPLSTPY